MRPQYLPLAIPGVLEPGLWPPTRAASADADYPQLIRSSALTVNQRL